MVLNRATHPKYFIVLIVTPFILLFVKFEEFTEFFSLYCLVFSRNKKFCILLKVAVFYILQVQCNEFSVMACFVFHRFEICSFVLWSTSLQCYRCVFPRNSPIFTFDLCMPSDVLVWNFMANIWAICFIGTASLLTRLFPMHPLSTPWKN